MKIAKSLTWIILILLIGLVIAALVVLTVFKDEIFKITLNDYKLYKIQ
jgi:hypothetical protein